MRTLPGLIILKNETKICERFRPNYYSERRLKWADARRPDISQEATIADATDLIIVQKEPKIGGSPQA